MLFHVASVAAAGLLKYDMVTSLSPTKTFIYVWPHPLTVQIGVFRNVTDVKTNWTLMAAGNGKIEPVTMAFRVAVASNKAVIFIRMNLDDGI